MYSVRLLLKQGTVNMGSILWYSRERVSKTDIEEKKLLNKVIIFVFFIYKNILIAS